MSSFIIDDLATLKALTGPNKFNGLALLVMAKKAWYVCDLGAIDSADDDAVVLPDDGIGRWFKCNNEANILNSGVNQATTSGTTTVDFSNYEEIQLVLSQNTTINFQTTLRNGYGYLVLNRNGGTWTITGWDVRTKFSGASYNFSSSSVTVAILSLVFINNVIYVTKVTEYS